MATDTSKVIASRDIKMVFKSWHSTDRFPADTVPWATGWGTPSTR